MADEYKYWAFISYSHRDVRWAEWLHRQLETYRVPRRLVGRPSSRGPLPRRLLPVFRDRDELPGSADLAASIERALRASRHLIVVCSPRAAVSKYVNEEIRTFKALGRADRVLYLIVDGEPGASERPESGELECFPSAARFSVDATGLLSRERVEPVAADGRPGKDGRTNAFLKIVAGLLDVGFDELRRREHARRLRQRLVLGSGIAAAVATMTFSYALMADGGVKVPGGEPIRIMLDRQGVSVFRAVHADELRHASFSHGWPDRSS